MKNLPRLLVLGLIVTSSTVLAADYSPPPGRNPENLIIGTYNIQFLGNKWHDYDKLTSVIQHFDVLAVQEVKDEKALRQLTERLEALTEKDWGYVFGRRTHRPGGSYHEAFGVLFRRDRVQLGDGLVSNVWDRQERYRNDPMFTSFRAGYFDFTLLQVHTRWTDDAEGTRRNEVKGLVDHVQFVASTLEEDDIVLVGDFNYSGTKDEMKPLLDYGLIQVDPNLKTTIKTNGKGFSSAYDHIYITGGVQHEYSGNSSAMDPTVTAYGSDDDVNRKKVRSELSDHIPVWAEFLTNKEDDDGIPFD